MLFLHWGICPWSRLQPQWRFKIPWKLGLNLCLQRWPKPSLGAVTNSTQFHSRSYNWKISYGRGLKNLKLLFLNMLQVFEFQKERSGFVTSCDGWWELHFFVRIHLKTYGKDFITRSCMVRFIAGRYQLIQMTRSLFETNFMKSSMPSLWPIYTLYNIPTYTHTY